MQWCWFGISADFVTTTFLGLFWAKSVVWFNNGFICTVSPVSLVGLNVLEVSTCMSPDAAVWVGQWLKALLRLPRRLRMSRSSSAFTSAKSTRTTLSRRTTRCLPCQHTYKSGQKHVKGWTDNLLLCCHQLNKFYPPGWCQIIFI